MWFVDVTAEDFINFFLKPRMEDDKKLSRKLNRFAVRLKSSKGLIATEKPGPNIVLYNVGQATGFDKESLNRLLKEKSLVVQPKLIAEKGEFRSYLQFKSTEESTLFNKVCNGRIKIDDKGTPLYLSYVDSVPDIETICPHSNPKGLILLCDFISEIEEKQFINHFDWHNTNSNLKNRQVKHYGYEFRYGTNDVDLNCLLNERIPNICDVLWRRLEEQGYRLGIPDQLTVNKYSPGQGIPSHVDRHSPFGDTILSLSLGSDVVMEWKHHTGKTVPVLVPRRSMMIMQDEARYDWQHGIQSRTHDPVIEVCSKNNNTYKVITCDTVPRETRISLTFRWTRRGPCQCNFPALCDSTIKKELDDTVASSLEELHVHQVYEQIAGHFSSTRHTPWPRVVDFLRSASNGDVVLDLGAGNGKNILKRNDILQIACERSSGLLLECTEHSKHIAGADCVRLDLLAAPIKDNIADRALCIAVIHHFTTRARRLQAISTIFNLLRPSGLALITVWAKDQTKSNYLCKTKESTENARVTVVGVNLPIHENRTQFQHQDLLVPWKLQRKFDKSVDKLDKKSKDKLHDQSENKIVDHSADKLGNESPNTLLRYYHVFEEGELDELCKEVGFVIQNSFYEEGNWCVVGKKN